VQDDFAADAARSDGQISDADAERFCQKVASIGTDTLRAKVAALELARLTPAVAALLLGRLVRLSRDRPQAANALGAVDRALMRGEIDAEFVAEAQACARSRADRLVEALFATGPAARTYDQNEEQFVDRRMRTLTLGQRRALSRTRDIDLLLRLAHDQDPRVVSELLQNPRLTEREAVIIASRRPTHAHILEAVLASRFGGSRRVRRAIAHNPYSTVAQAVRALATLTIAELRLVSEDEHVTAEVRKHAGSLSINRRPTPAERDATAARPPELLDEEVLRNLSAQLESDEELEIIALGADGRPVRS
jgi:hypothetical protein